MSDLIVGKDIPNKDKMQFCSSHSLELFRDKLPSLDSFIQQFLEVHITPYFQREQRICQDEEDSIVWHPCENNPHYLDEGTFHTAYSPIVTDEKWLVFLDKDINIHMMGLLFILSPQVLIQYDLKDDQHIISQLLNISYYMKHTLHR